ncbi:MAG: acetyl-lysine deacetylase, partial [Phycisphaerae bacterium]|nr:acetyl-lysine deacetylase [Phycisphaerae bacterium]
AFAFLERLVGTPSVSGEEAAAAEVFADGARSLGFEVEIDQVGNAIATRRAIGERRRQIVLLGHIDTVPGEIPVRVEDGVLHGRGAVDAKGPLVALLVGAARAELTEGVEVVVVAAVGEEASESIGAKAIRDRYRPDACIIGEPSGWDGVTLGYKGRLVVEATCRRSLAHTAGPDGSARDALLRWWTEATAHAAKVSEPAERAFDTLQATVHNWRSLDDWQTDGAEMRCGFRLPPGVNPRELFDLLRAFAGEGIELDLTGEETAHATTRDDPVVRALSAAIRAEGGRPRPKLKTGTADLNVVGPAWGCPIAAYGPGDSSLDHTPEERVSDQEFTMTLRVVRVALQTFSNT